MSSDHRDYFGKDINVGDILLGARAGGRYVDTSFNFVVVVSKTKRLIRVHQCNGTDPRTITASIVREGLKKRAGRPAGKAVPQAFLNTGVNVGLTQKEMEDTIEAGKQITVTVDSICNLWP